MSHINWRKPVAHQPTEDTGLSRRRVQTFSTCSRQPPAGAAGDCSLLPPGKRGCGLTPGPRARRWGTPATQRPQGTAEVEEMPSPGGQISGMARQRRRVRSGRGLDLCHPIDLHKGYHATDRAQGWQHRQRPRRSVAP